LIRFAHLSDLHLNGTVDRFRKTLAGLEDADRWGANYLLLTGDLTARGRPDEYQQLGELLSGWDRGCTVVPGNHDGGSPTFMAALARFFPQFEDTSTPGALVDLGDAMVLALDTQYANRALVFRALGNVGHAQLTRLAQVLPMASAQKHLVVAMHHGPQGHMLGFFDGLTDRGRVSKLLGSNPHVSVCCGHDHRVLDMGKVHTAASVATFLGDPLRIYDVAGGRFMPSHQSLSKGNYFSFAGLPK
jgi:3',5'-cyclic AMP phosphodiesterase CpdA